MSDETTRHPDQMKPLNEHASLAHDDERIPHEYVDQDHLRDQEKGYEDLHKRNERETSDDKREDISDLARDRRLEAILREEELQEEEQREEEWREEQRKQGKRSQMAWLREKRSQMKNLQKKRWEIAMRDAKNRQQKEDPQPLLRQGAPSWGAEQWREMWRWDETRRETGQSNDHGRGDGYRGHGYGSGGRSGSSLR